MTMRDMNRDELALMLSTELSVIRELIRDHCLNAHGLQTCRRRLRHPDTITSAVTLGMTDLRAIALDEVCRASANNDGELDYYRGVGDLLMTAPDDIGGIA